jgi:hypothetical protein
METHETEREQAQHRPTPVPQRGRDDSLAVGLSEALAGRPDRLDAKAIQHLQRNAGNESVGTLLEQQEESPVTEVVRSGGGSPLDTGTRNFMEARLGHDFGDVRVHSDARATESARSVKAQAYTVGTDVVFQSDQYSPQTESGKRMLAHELTHVVQQKSGPVDGTPIGGGVSLSHPSDRFEQAAEATANQAMASPVPTAATATAQGASVQRATEEDKDEDPSVQGSFLQRVEDEEDDKDQPTS